LIAKLWAIAGLSIGKKACRLNGLARQLIVWRI
jgi:hypothetical protein